MESWNWAVEEWEKTLAENPPNPNTAEFDSEKGERYSEQETATEEESDEEKVKPFPLPQRTSRRSSSAHKSSSDESSNKSNYSSSDSRNKTKKCSKTFSKQFNDVNENLGNIEDRLVAMKDTVGNISNEICQASEELRSYKTIQKKHNNALKEAFVNQLHVFEEKSNDKISQLGSEISNLRNDLKESQASRNELESNFSQLGNEIVNVRNDLKESQTSKDELESNFSH